MSLLVLFKIDVFLYLIITRNLPNMPLYLSHPLVIKRTCRVGGSKRIFTVNLTEAFKLTPEYARKPMLLRWIMRPVPIRSLDEVQASILNKNKWSKQRITDEPYLLLNTHIELGWEVVVTHNRHEYLRYSQDVSSAFVTRNVLGGHASWLACSTFIKDPPKKAEVELRVYVKSKDPELVFDTFVNYLGVEVKDSLAYTVPIDEFHYIGKDAFCLFFIKETASLRVNTMSGSLRL